MRLLLTAFLLATAACGSAPPDAAKASAESAAANISSAYSSTSPQLKPETIAGCNAVNLKVGLGADGVISVNGDPSSMEGLKAAAVKKDAACQNASALVVYSYAGTAPAETRDAIKLLLKQTIVNLTLTEASEG